MALLTPASRVPTLLGALIEWKLTNFSSSLAAKSWVVPTLLGALIEWKLDRSLGYLGRDRAVSALREEFLLCWEH